MAEQKKIREEFNNAPVKTLDTLKSELAELQSAVIAVSSGSRKQSVQAAHLNEEALKLERSFAMVQKTPDLAYDSTQDSPALTQYFNKFITSSGDRVLRYKQEVQAIEELLSSRARASLTPKELAEVLRKLDEQFISLAAQLYTAKEDVNAVKMQFLRQFRTTNGEKPLISLSDLETPLPQTSFDLLEKDFKKSSALGHTPYGPSPFSMSAADSPASTVAVSVQPTMTSGAQGLLQTLTSTGNPSTPSGGLFSLGGTPGTTTTTAGATPGFSFGSGLTGAFGATSTAAPTTTSAFGFGLAKQPSATPTPTFGFAASTAATPATTSAFAFGTPAAATATTTTTTSSFSPFGGKSLFGLPK
ncbi:hypothetical protein AAHC03_01933 [Spirometra sp. Aus1]